MTQIVTDDDIARMLEDGSLTITEEDNCCLLHAIDSNSVKLLWRCITRESMMTMVKVMVDLHLKRQGAIG